ncbi:DNA polymerase delta subunit 3 isoform X2 [Cololabis saira]|uniref:DNA polymerase delta subunit 3 isoform X2 n=1 Tax=Cololabis saira TaxID=129043 RepID=UPI002AD48268|nr:DNA polymerase delta subunit 3 isoform X2 [Cololabis saira]
MDELYLDNIDEFVNDHNKIVTYKWLSLTLGVHVNTAKQMLFQYLDHKRKESSPQLHATYLVSGKVVDNGQACHKVSVVREDKLEDFKAKMSLVVSVHVYSVQKALLKDSGPLYSVDYDAVKENLKTCSKYSAIRCASAVPMSSVELQQVRELQQAPVPEPEKKTPSTNGNTSVAQKSSVKQQKGIMGMFSSKSTIKPEQKEAPPVVDVPKSKPVAKSNSMMNFFGTQTKKPDKPVKEEEAAPSSSPAEQQQRSPRPQEKEDKKEKQEEKKEKEKEEAAAAQPQKDRKKDSRSKTKRIEDSDGEEDKMEKKKRRRIKRPEPDSSDEDIIPDSPQQMETQEPSPKKVEVAVPHSHEKSETKMRKRRRVLKTRTFADDEGCMVTEKVYESESYSETEDDFQAAKPAPKAKLPSSSKDEGKKSQKKPSMNSNKGTKQASIMGFFQKK